MFTIHELLSFMPLVLACCQMVGKLTLHSGRGLFNTAVYNILNYHIFIWCDISHDFS